MKVVVWANCQGKTLSSVLSKWFDVSYYINYDYMARQEPPPSDICECDIFVYQHYVGHRDTKWDIDVILGSLKEGCKVISFPFITFDGYFFPESVWNIKKKDLRCDEHPFGLWSTISFKNEDFEYILASRHNSLESRQQLVKTMTEKVCSVDYISSLDILNNLNTALIKLEEREERSTVKGFAEYIRQNMQDNRLFNHSVHPGNAIMRQISTKVAACVDREVDEDDSAFGALNDYQSPIHPKVVQCLGLKFDPNAEHAVYTDVRSYRDIVRTQIRDYLIPDECICSKCANTYKMTY